MLQSYGRQGIGGDLRGCILQMNTKVTNISQVCKSCSACFLQAAINGTGRGSITTSIRRGFYPLGSNSLWRRQQFQTQKGYKDLSAPSSSLSFSPLVSADCLNNTKGLSGSYIFQAKIPVQQNIRWTSQLLHVGKMRGAKHRSIMGSTRMRTIWAQLSAHFSTWSSGCPMDISGCNISIVGTRIYQCMSLCLKCLHSETQEVDTL